MGARSPLVLIGGLPATLPAGDTLSGIAIAPASGAAAGGETSIAAPAAIPAAAPWWCDLWINGAIQIPGTNFTTDGSAKLTFVGFTLSAGDTWYVRQYQKGT